MARITTTIARDLMKEHSIDYFELATGGGTSDRVWQVVRRKVRNLRPTTLAMIVWSAPHHVSLYSVHCCTWLDKYGSARSLLRDLAATVLVAEMIQLTGAA